MSYLTPNNMSYIDQLEEKTKKRTPKRMSPSSFVHSTLNLLELSTKIICDIKLIIESHNNNMELPIAKMHAYYETTLSEFFLEEISDIPIHRNWACIEDMFEEFYTSFYSTINIVQKTGDELARSIVFKPIAKCFFESTHSDIMAIRYHINKLVEHLCPLLIKHFSKPIREWHKFEIPKTEADYFYSIISNMSIYEIKAETSRVCRLAIYECRNLIDKEGYKTRISLEPQLYLSDRDTTENETYAILHGKKIILKHQDWAFLQILINSNKPLSNEKCLEYLIEYDCFPNHVKDILKSISNTNKNLVNCISPSGHEKKGYSIKRNYLEARKPKT